MSKWIKNDTVSQVTYLNQDIAAGAYYQLKPGQEEINWSNLSTLLTDIGNGDAIVAKDDSGNTDFTDVNEAINYLKGNLPTDVKAEMKGIKDPAGLRARLKGIFCSTITAGNTKDCDWLCEQLTYNSVNKESFFDGIQYFAKDGEIGDTSKFQVVDKGDPGAGSVGVTLGWYDQATFDAMGNEYIVEQFGDNWYMMPDKESNLLLYKAKIIPGLYIRVKYTSTGTNDVKLVCNLFRHLDENS